MRRLHPVSMLLAFGPRIKGAIQTVGPVLFVSLIGGKRDPGDSVELALAAIGVLGGLGAIAEYITTRFGIEEGEFRMRKGWLFRQDRRVPLVQVQNVTLRRTLVERILRVTTVEVETAAGSGAEIKLRVLSERDAEALRTELAHGLAPVGEEAPEGDVLAVPRSEMALAALSENHFGSVILWLLTTFGFGVPIALVALADVGRFHLPGWLLGLFVGSAVALVAGVGWVTGAARFMMKYGDFRVVREPTLLRVSHGLTGRTETVIRRSRVELVRVSESAIQRRIGRATVHAATAATFGEGGAEATIAPMLRGAEAAMWVGDLLPGTDLRALTFRRFPGVVIARQVVTGLILSALFGGVLLFTGVSLARDGMPFSGFIIGMGAVMLALGPVGLLDAVLGWRIGGLAIGSGVVAVRTGFLTRNTMLLPLTRLESLSLVQPPWWRRRDLTAGSARGMMRSVALPGLRGDERRVLEAVLANPGAPAAEAV